MIEILSILQGRDCKILTKCLGNSQRLTSTFFYFQVKKTDFQSELQAILGTNDTRMKNLDL